MPWSQKKLKFGLNPFSSQQHYSIEWDKVHARSTSNVVKDRQRRDSAPWVPAMGADWLHMSLFTLVTTLSWILGSIFLRGMLQSTSAELSSLGFTSTSWIRPHLPCEAAFAPDAFKRSELVFKIQKKIHFTTL